MGLWNTQPPPQMLLTYVKFCLVSLAELRRTVIGIEGPSLLRESIHLANSAHKLAIKVRPHILTYLTN